MIVIRGLSQGSYTPKTSKKKTTLLKENTFEEENAIILLPQSNGIKIAESAAQAFEQVHYDHIDQKQREALTAYQRVMHYAKREVISDMFYVDIYV